MYDKQTPALSFFTGCLGLAMLCFLLSIIFTGFPIVIVNPGEIAATTRFGSYSGTLGEGLHIQFFTRANWYDLKVQKLESEQAAATKDLQDITIAVVANYSIKKENVENIFKTVGSNEQVRSNILEPIISSELKSITTQYTGESLLQKREEVEKRAFDNVATKLTPYGITLNEFSLTNMTFTNEEYNKAIDRKQIAEQQAQQAKFELERAKLKAEEQKITTSTLTEAILRKLWIEKWDGKLPQYIGDDAKILLGIK